MNTSSQSRAWLGRSVATKPDPAAVIAMDCVKRCNALLIEACLSRAARPDQEPMPQQGQS
ncbi:hypothetical protein LC55x_1786 [Lysobacter capsici]|nr:hypothetical protein LC55x_1786 [Lysobacter capsici]